MVRNWSVSRTIAATLGALALSTAAQAASFSGVVVIGDSIVDSGNANAGAILAGVPSPTPSPPYFQGRFSNGYTYADLLSLKITGDPADALLTSASPFDPEPNYATGGAGATLNPYQGMGIPDSIPDLAEQVDLYVNGGMISGIPVAPGLDGDALHVVHIGGNDFLAARLGIQDPAALAAAAAASMTTALTQLVDAGANQILVANVPSVIAFGADTPQQQAALFGAISAYNDSLNGIIQSLNLADPDNNVMLFDNDGLTNAILFDPAAFGFDPGLIGQPCILSPEALAMDCLGYTDFDSVHPTAAVHRIFAAAAMEQLGLTPVPVPAAAPLMLAGLALLARKRRKAA